MALNGRIDSSFHALKGWNGILDKEKEIIGKKATCQMRTSVQFSGVLQ
jgi:hypothetical protein